MVESRGELLRGVAPGVQDRLAAYVADVASGLVRSEQREYAGQYARGLIADGARKSLEPMVARMGGGKVQYEGLQNFLADSPWDSALIDRAVAEAWIESLFSHIKADWPHLDAIVDPAVLRAEVALVRVEYNTVRLHAAIGYVTPNDEHEGRGPQIRRARRVGLMRARPQRIAYHRLQHRQSQPPESR